MSVNSADLIYNVSGLLQDAVGAVRSYDVSVSELQLDEENAARDVAGSLRLTRINTGLLAQADVGARIESACVRCLEPTETQLEATIEEEFRQVVDRETGAAKTALLDGEDEEVFSLLTRNHMLDLAEPLRQSLLIALPFRPICGEDCEGLCQLCGANLNERDCGCEPVPVDPRFAELAALLNDNQDQRRAV